MEQSKPIRIESSLLDDAESERPKYFGTTTTWIAYLIRVGLNYHLGLDPCGRLGKPNDTEREKEKREVLPITNSSNNINKKKTHSKQNKSTGEINYNSEEYHKKQHEF